MATENLSHEVQQIHGSSISKKSMELYMRGIRKFLLWHQVNAPHLLNDAYKNVDIQKYKLMQDLHAPFPLAEGYTVNNFEVYLTAIKKKDGSKPEPSTLNSHRSAFTRLWHIFNREIPTSFGDSLKEYFRGAQRISAQEKGKGSGKVQTGKDAMSFSLYAYLCRKLLTIGDESAIFAHTYMTMSWNLMCRAGNTASICFSHLQWQDDALCVYFAHMKNDQLGTRPKDPRHLYANPETPEISCILALGIYLLCIEIPNTKAGNLFPGEKQYDRLQKTFKRLYSIPDVAEYLSANGIKAANLGTHSTRKGAATYVTGGSTAGPSIVAIQLRAGWTIEGVMSRYTRFEAAGDQYVGRCVSGLPINSHKFAHLPPFFKTIGPEVNRAISICFPKYNASMYGILQFCLASVIFHTPFLKETLPKNHLLFASPLFQDTSLFNTLAGAVICPIDDGTQRIRASGIPPHVSLLVSMIAVANEVRTVPQRIISGVSDLLEQRSEDAGSITRAGVANMLHACLKPMEDRIIATLARAGQPQATTPPTAKGYLEKKK
jgi:hypothetical protein